MNIYNVSFDLYPRTYLHLVSYMLKVFWMTQLLFLIATCVCIYMHTYLNSYNCYSCSRG